MALSAFQVAIVTSGAQGIGRGLCKALLLDKGTTWKVVAVDRDVAGCEDAKQFFAEIPNVSGEVRVVVGDVGDAHDARRIVADTVRDFGRLDLLLNNAGGGGFVNFADQTADGWMSVINANLSSVFFMSQAAAPTLTECKGCIINMASTRAFMSEPNTEAYSASKGGVVALTHAMAATLAHKVRVNGIAPGWIDVSGPQWGPGRTQHPISDADKSQHFTNSVGTPEDIADAVSYLCRASFVTGQIITVDGGMTKKMIYI